jgi:hypothetical protein
VIQITDQHDDDDGEDQGEQYEAQGDESQELEHEEDQFQTQGMKILYFSELTLYIITAERNRVLNFISTFLLILQ